VAEQEEQRRILAERDALAAKTGVRKMHLPSRRPPSSQQPVDDADFDGGKLPAAGGGVLGALLGGMG
jgi:hypothetical protein